MSYIFSQALVAEYLEVNCSAIRVFVRSSGSPMHNPSWWHGKTMAVSRHSRFGMMFSHLMEDHGADVLTWWLAGFPVRTSVLREKAQESTEPEAECGPTWPGLLAKFDPVSSTWKTVQHSLIEDSGESLATFPRSGMTRNGLLWALPKLAQTTKGTDFGFWPTPVASDISSRNTKYAQGGTPLSLAVKMWPTPQASDNRNRGTSQTPAIARRIEAGKQVMLSMVMDGPLNPPWVEWLMGWPIGWTALKPLEMDKSHNVPPQPLDT